MRASDESVAARPMRLEQARRGSLAIIVRCRASNQGGTNPYSRTVRVSWLRPRSKPRKTRRENANLTKAIFRARDSVARSRLVSSTLSAVPKQAGQQLLSWRPSARIQLQASWAGRCTGRWVIPSARHPVISTRSSQTGGLPPLCASHQSHCAPSTARLSYVRHTSSLSRWTTVVRHGSLMRRTLCQVSPSSRSLLLRWKRLKTQLQWRPFSTCTFAEAASVSVVQAIRVDVPRTHRRTAATSSARRGSPSAWAWVPSNACAASRASEARRLRHRRRGQA